MSDLQIYAVMNVVIDGTLLSEHAQASVRRQSGSNPVHTMAKGYAGETPGSKMIEFDVTNAVPAADFELDAGDWMIANKPVEFGVLVAGRQIRFMGFIISDTLRQGVNQEATYEFTARGQFAEYE